MFDFGKSFPFMDWVKYIRMSGEMLVAIATIFEIGEKFHGLFKPCAPLTEGTAPQYNMGEMR
jgi:hypothetical protein